LIKKKLGGDSKGVATLVIVIIVVVVIVIAGAGVAAYYVLGNHNSDNNAGGSGGGPGENPTPIGGPGFNAGESLTYTFSASMKGNAGTEEISANDALKGSITISNVQNSDGDYAVTLTIDLSVDMMGISDSYNTTQTVTLSSLDMAKFGADAADLTTLEDYGYTSADLQHLQDLMNKYTSTTGPLSTIDGNLNVEKRTYSYTSDDLMSLIPDEGSLTDMPINNLSLDMTLWLGNDIFYKGTIDLKMAADFDGTAANMEFNGTIELTSHT